MFLVPVIAGAIGITSAIGQAVVGAAVAVGLGLASRALAPKPATTAAAVQGAALSLQTDPNAPRQVILGRAATAGSLVYWQVSGPDNTVLDLVFALADHECEALDVVRVNGRVVTLTTPGGAYGGTRVEQYPDCMWIKFFSGAWGQAHDSDLASRSSGKWTASHRGRGVCYVRVTLVADAKKFPSGVPSFLFTIKGAKLYDPRLDDTVGGVGAHRWGVESTYAYTDNPVVAWYNWQRGITVGGQRVAGMSLPAGAFDVANVMAEANVCDETVALKSGGSELRYRLSGVYPATMTHRDVLASIERAMAGKRADCGGRIKVLAGIARAPVMHVTDDDLLSAAEVEVIGRRSRAELVNAVFGAYRAPQEGYEFVPLPPRTSSADEAADGGIRLEQRHDLDSVAVPGQGQRVLEIIRRRGRYQETVAAGFRAKAAVLEAGDWITWTSERHGWTDAAFEVVSATPGADLSPALVLQRTDASIYAWTAALDEIDVEDPTDLPSGAVLLGQVSGLAVQVITITGADGAARPGLQATWTAITDPTVIEIALEYRKVGDTVALERRALDAAAGVATWVDGIQGGLAYQVRARPITSPERATVWSAWAETPVVTTPHVVDVATYAETVNPANLPPADLSDQDRFELSLVTAVDAVTGSVAEIAARARAEAEAAAIATLRGLALGVDNRAAVSVERTERVSGDLALASQITTALAQIGSVQASVTAEIAARASADAALAQDVTTVQSAVAGNSASIQQVLASIDGLGAKWGVAVNVNGEILGLVQLEAGAAEGSTFTVVADRFGVALPGTAGGDPVPVFMIANVNGVPKLALRGDMIADGTIAARAISAATLSAITANVGELTAGIIRSGNGKTVIDLDTGSWYSDA